MNDEEKLNSANQVIEQSENSENETESENRNEQHHNNTGLVDTQTHKNKSSNRVKTSQISPTKQDYHKQWEEMFDILDSDDGIDSRALGFIEVGKRYSRLVFFDKDGGLQGGLQFARAEKEDWEEIKNLSTEELKRRFISYSASTEIDCSVKDRELIVLMHFELVERRGFDIHAFDEEIKAHKAELMKWYFESHSTTRK